MVNKKMDSSDNWDTSTPLQCRHDSGFESYPKHYELLVLSPIRKQTSAMQGVKSLGKSDKISPRRLNLSDLFNGKSSDNSADDSGFASNVNSTRDSGIASSFDESDSERDLPDKKTSHFVVDENCNFINLLDTGKELYQPSKYICKDHSHESEGKCNRNTDASKKIFKSYAISSEIFNWKQKNSKIDFLYELDTRNCSGIISDILSYLSDEDLRQSNNVSKKWQEIVSSDRNANGRRTSYINNKKNAAHGPNKENNGEIATPVERTHKSAFTSLANFDNDTKQPLIFENTQGRFDSFIKELKTDGNQQALVKCPKCRYPARADTEFKHCCSRNLCKHEFCRKCLGPFLDNHKCSVPELNDSRPSIIVGSKKSRKNLRRLKA